MRPVVGLSVREHNRALVASSAVAAVEFTFERANSTLLHYRDDVALRDKTYRAVHALKASPGSTTPPADAYVDAIAAFAHDVAATSISDHLGLTHHGDRDLGHFAPVVYHFGAVRTIARNCAAIQRRLERAGVTAPLFLENIAYLADLFPQHATMSESEFLCEVLRATGCGLLLDVENVHANATNFGYDAVEFIDRVAAVGARCQIHLAGGHTENGVYLDSHSRPVPDATWALFRHALRVLPTVEAVFVERDAAPARGPVETTHDLERANAIVAEVCR